jgi:hypothetical protein
MPSTNGEVSLPFGRLSWRPRGACRAARPRTTPMRTRNPPRGAADPDRPPPCAYPHARAREKSLKNFASGSTRRTAPQLPSNWSLWPRPECRTASEMACGLIAGRVPARESRKSSGVQSGGPLATYIGKSVRLGKLCAPTLPEVLFGAIKRISTWCRAGWSRARSFVQASCCRRSAMHVTPLSVAATRPSALRQKSSGVESGDMVICTSPPSQSHEETVGSPVPELI